jgi:hypothetical protein
MKKIILFIFMISILNAKIFKKLNEYSVNNFNFTWDIETFELVTFNTFFSYREILEDKFIIKFHAILKNDNIKYTKDRNESMQKLAKFLYKKRDYFWKTYNPTRGISQITMLFFTLHNDRKFYVITDLKDIKDMLGDIDSEAKLALWLYAKDDYYTFRCIKDYYQIKQYYRVIYECDDSYSCIYKKYMKEYDKNGDVTKESIIDKYNKKDCKDFIPF